MNSSQLDEEELKQLRREAGRSRRRAIDLYRTHPETAAPEALRILTEVTEWERTLRDNGIEPEPPPPPVERTEEERYREEYWKEVAGYSRAPLEPSQPRQREMVPGEQGTFDF